LTGLKKSNAGQQSWLLPWAIFHARHALGPWNCQLWCTGTWEVTWLLPTKSCTVNWTVISIWEGTNRGPEVTPCNSMFFDGTPPWGVVGNLQIG
jgi:hypothetical protein